MLKRSVLVMDIGGGTQDILVYDPEDSMENAVKMVVPAPTVMAARRIARVTDAGAPLFLAGQVMGGGAVSRAIKRHMEAGLEVYSLKDPALSIHDNLEKVQGMGVRIVDGHPGREAVEVVLGDIDLETVALALGIFEVDLPGEVALAIQDHGFSPGFSNRLTRFRQWQNFLDTGGDMDQLLFMKPPETLSRWMAAARSVPGACFMDTSAAALRGALVDEYAREHLSGGLMVVNAGNEHTVAFLVRDRRVWGVYEHHTSLLDRKKLADQLDRFSRGDLPHEEIFDQWGHGVAYQPGAEKFQPFHPLVITGPRREVAEGLGHMAAPYGEMMLSGCFGLVEALKEKQR